MPARLGELEQAGDRWRLRFTRRLPHPPEKVWRAITEPKHLAAWFPQEVEGEWTVGSRLRFVDRTTDEVFEFDGEVLAVEDGKLVEFVWGEDVIRIEVAPDGDATVLTLLDTFDEQGKAARDAAGWHGCLDLLEAALAERDPDFDPQQRWAEMHPRYVEHLGPEASTIGPPEGFTAES